jgi:translocation and assembly module TamB
LKALRITAISLLALVLLLVLLAAWALRTESGSRAALSLARGWLPPGMTVTQVGGAIAGTLRIQGFRYRDEALGLDIVVDAAEVELMPGALLVRRVSVRRAMLDGVRVELFEGRPSDAPREPARDPWRAPIDLSLSNIGLARVEFRQAGQDPLPIRRVQLAGSWIGARIEASELVVDTADGHVELSARIAERAPRLEQLRGKFRWRVDGQTWEGALEASGGREQLNLAARLNAPLSMQASGQLQTVFQDDRLESWRARLDVPRFNPYPVIDTESFETVGLVLDATGDTRAVELTGELSLDEQRVIIERLAGAYRDALVDIAALRVRLNAQPGVLSGSARLKLDAPRSASASLEWDEIELPEAWAGAQFRFAGRAALTAVPDRFAANGNARLSRAGRASTLSFRLDGDRDALRIEELELTQAPGQLSVRGRVDLGDAVSWKLQAQGKAFDPSLFLEAWPGALDFDLDTDGAWPKSAPRARVRLPRLAGKLRGRAISGHANLTLGEDLRPRGSAHLQSGSAVLDASATPGPSPSVDATLTVGALEEWRSGLRGAVEVRLNSRGRWPEVQIQARADATGLNFDGDSLNSATLKVDGRLGRALAGRAGLEARGVKVAGFDFDQLEASVDGNEEAHRVALDARGDALELALRANGAFARKAWQGQLDSLALNIDGVPPLALAQPARLGYAPGALTLDTACLHGGDIRLCTGLRGDAGGFVANYSIEALPLQLITALTAPGSKVAVEGLLAGSGDLSRAPDGTFGGRATLLSASGALTQGQGDQALRLAYRDFKLDADLARGAGRAELHAVLVDQGELNGRLDIGVGEKDPSLAGQASVGLRDLAPLAWWVPQLAQMRGSAHVDVEVGGTVSAPRVAFTLRGTGLDAEVPLLGVHLREGNFSAALRPERGFEAEGSIKSGDGALTVSGARDASGGIKLEIGGGNFLAANVPGARITIAPDLALTGKPGDLLLAGSVTLEEAEVQLEKLSINKTYRASSDVVIVDREQQSPSRPLGLTTDVRIILGKKVTLNGFGLESTLSGELRVVEKENEVSRATGEVLVAGTYEAFGRKLNIERGRLQYAGTPLDDPQLDILAVRKIDDITARLRVTGSALQPKLDVTTDPAMSQTDAMSYLLTGKSASDLHGQDGAEVQSAAQSVGSVLGNRLAKKLGGKMGFVDEIGVEQNNDLGGSAFTVGKYLSPKLFVSYGVGLFEPGSAVTVRYEFTKHWSLEANDTPEDQHAGIRYRIEK